MKKTRNFKQQVLRKLRDSKGLLFILSIVIVPLFILLTNIPTVLSSESPPNAATFAKFKGIIRVFPGGDTNSPKTPNQYPQLTGIGSQKPDILWVAKTPPSSTTPSWAHIQLWRDFNLVSPVIQAGTDNQDTQYTFPCKIISGGGVIAWGIRQQNPWSCEQITIKNSAWKKSDLQNLYFAEKAMTKENNNAPEILERLQEVNINYSVAKSALLEWISDSDRRYYNVALECLKILQNQRLKNEGPDIDVIFYYYKKILGVEQLPENPQINQEKLKEAIRRAYNNKNGTDFQSFEEIVEDAKFIQSEVQISPNEDLTLIYIHHLQENNNLVIDVLAGSVTIQANSTRTGERYNTNQGDVTNIQNFNQVVSEQSVQIFLNTDNWSESMKTLINSFNQKIVRNSRSDFEPR